MFLGIENGNLLVAIKSAIESTGNLYGYFDKWHNSRALLVITSYRSLKFEE